MQTIHITANSRLTASIKQQAVLASTQNVVQTPKVMTLAQWWQEWQNAAMLTGRLAELELPKKVLSAFEAQWLFEHCLQTVLLELKQKNQASGEQDDHFNLDDERVELLNIPSTAKQLYQAWTLTYEWIADWQGDALLGSTFHSAETELYKQVLQRYLQRLQQKNWQDEALYAQTLLKALAGSDAALLPQRFSLHGFDDLTPNMRTWRNIVQDLGVVVESDSETVSNDGFQLQHQGLTCYPAQDAFDEAQQVAAWAIRQLAEQVQSKPLAEIKIALVAPDVAEYKGLLTQCLDEQLYLNGLGKLSSQEVSRNRLYNVSLGASVLSVPLIENAWQTLSLFLQPHKSIAYQAWSEWLISPYTFGNYTQRHQADAEFRRLQWANLNWTKLLATESAAKMPKALLNNIQKWQEQFAEISHYQVTLLEFVDKVWQLLSTLGWPGCRSLNSEEYQQKTAFENALTFFSALTDLSGKQNYAAWLSLLKRFLSEQVHQPQSVGHQPIQIMGMLEAGGQAFDCLWILGLTNEAWPRMPSPNPFIPMHLQRQLGMPRSDANRELLYAQQLSQRLVDSAAQVCWSYPRQLGEAALLPTSIFPNASDSRGADSNVSEFVPITYQSLAQAIFSSADSEQRLQWQEDAIGLPIPAGSVAPGGTGILQAQSQCPLMAYVDYRLGAKYGFQQVEDSLQNTNQGTLIHAVLELFWQETQTQVAMLALTAEQKIERLKTHIETAFNELQQGLSAAILEVEQARILELCLEWLKLEESRESFKVLETEQEHRLQLAGIEFKIIIDRVDQIGSDTLILDYKTGRASIDNLLKTPLAAPQLAVYLLAAEQMQQQVVGIGYGMLHSDDGVKINAVVEDEEVINKARTIKVFSKLAEKEDSDYYQTSWNDFLDHLKQQVLELAKQVQQGRAEMTFDKPADIQYAEGYLALRVPEVLQQRQESAFDSETDVQQEAEA